MLFITIETIYSENGQQSTGPKPFYFSQSLDHFSTGNMSKIMFEQRYFIDKSFWAGSNSKTPLIVYLGGEDPIDNEVQAIGVINQAAPKFRALVLYIEVCHLNYVFMSFNLITIGKLSAKF